MLCGQPITRSCRMLSQSTSKAPSPHCPAFYRITGSWWRPTLWHFPSLFPSVWQGSFHRSSVQPEAEPVSAHTFLHHPVKSLLGGRELHPRWKSFLLSVPLIPLCKTQRCVYVCMCVGSYSKSKSQWFCPPHHLSYPFPRFPSIGFQIFLTVTQNKIFTFQPSSQMHSKTHPVLMETKFSNGHPDQA